MAGPTRSKSATSTPKRAAGTKRKRDESIAPPTTTKRRTKSIKRETNDDEASTTTLTPWKATKTSRLPVKQEMQDCDICAETLPAYRNFPSLSTCDHDATVCSKCFERQFITRIDAHRASGWDACTCPLCNVAVVPEEAQGIIPRTLAKEINVMIKKAQTQVALNWIWCPAPKCDHGQIYQVTKSPFVSCGRCKTRICFAHKVKWHEGMSCSEFEEASNQDEATKKNLLEIKRTTKPCPFCQMRIKKEGGCNHMSCTGCKKQWMWNDVPFDGEARGTTAEVAGGPPRARTLTQAERVVVDQVIQAENNRVDGRGRSPLNDVLGFIQGHAEMVQRQMQRLTALFGPGTVPAQPARLVVNNVRPVLAPPQGQPRPVAQVRPAVAPRQPAQARPRARAQRGRRGLAQATTPPRQPATLIGTAAQFLRGIVRGPSAPPESAIRTTVNAGRGQEMRRDPTETAWEVAREQAIRAAAQVQMQAARDADRVRPTARLRPVTIDLTGDDEAQEAPRRRRRGNEVPNEEDEEEEEVPLMLRRSRRSLAQVVEAAGEVRRIAQEIIDLTGDD